MSGQPPSTSTPESASSAPKAAAGAAHSPLTKPKPPPRQVPSALRPLLFFGIPRSVLSWQPKLPSRNWSIFFITVGTISYLYWDDRRQCKLIREEYKAKVRHMAEEKLDPSGWPRKVLVLGAKTPGDDDFDKSLRYFKKYVKPILVSAAIDWDVINGTRHGGLARELAERIQQRRRRLAGLESWSDSPSAANPDVPSSPFALTPAEQLQREIDGATVILGRPALKEWAWGMREGWTTELQTQKVDQDDALAQVLAEDGAFDEVLPEEKESATADGAEADGAGAPLASRLGSQFGAPQPSGPNAFSALLVRGSQQPFPAPAASNAPRVDPSLIAPPSQIPAQPPICFVDFTNLVGWRNIPRRIGGFFRQRDKVLAGAQDGLRICLGAKETARPFETGPEPVPETPPQGGDLDWGLASEERYPPFFFNTVKNIETSRERFYTELPGRLKAARELARGEREPTKTEKNHPPPTEQELREERLRKEKEWRGTLMGYEIVKPDAGVAWDERFRPALRVFTDPPADYEPPRSSESEAA